MKTTILLLFFISFLSCQRELSSSDRIVTRTTADSLQGRWKYVYDYRLVATTANPDVIIDSAYSGHYVPLSYYELNADSSFKWYRTTMLQSPTFGYGTSGKWWFNSSSREISHMDYRITQDDFGAGTTTLNPPQNGVKYKIKYLSSDSMVLYFRVQGQTPGHYWYWHDVFTR